MRQLNDPWHPMTDSVDLKYLGKLSEESGELTQAVGRCIIQGIDGHEPDSKKVNRTWLEEELADVWANSELVIERFGLDRNKMLTRRDEKIRRLRMWHNQA